ncbi:MAG: SHOCT domain-containing protein [Acidimicrobiia bacterium]
MMWGGAWMFWMALVWLAFGGLVVWAVLRATGSPRDRQALAILEARFARGEIDATEFESRRQALLGR